MKRIFIAVDVLPSSRLKEDYELIRHRMRLEKINWVEIEQMHLTLSFLGDTEEEKVPGIITMLKEFIAEQSPFELTLRSLGVFKNLREPRVLWMGCDPCTALAEIKKKIDQGLTRYGFEAEDRPFSPHVTLGRIKDIRQLNQLAQLITLFKDKVFQQQRIDKIVLYESVLSVKGPEYSPLQIIPLQASF